MRNIRRGVPALVLALALAWPGAGAAVAADQPAERERAEKMAREAMEQLLNALEMFLESIPQYEMPEVNEHGDIIIRRKRKPDRVEPDEPELDSTRT